MTDRDEWRYDVEHMTDAEREESCGHTTWTSGKRCPSCGITADDQ